MKTLRLILMLLVCCACSWQPPTLAATIQEIEQLPFDKAYRLWLEEKEIFLKMLPTEPIGSTDPQTGKFTPTNFWALTCRLGREAQKHESFLLSALTTDD